MALRGVITRQYRRKIHSVNTSNIRFLEVYNPIQDQGGDVRGADGVWGRGVTGGGSQKEGNTANTRTHHRMYTATWESKTAKL